MYQSPEAYIEEFKQRQNCPHIFTDDRMQMVFENGARIQIRNDRGEPDVGGEVEPPFRDEEDRLRRELDYWKLMHRREHAAWTTFKDGLLQAATYAASGTIHNYLAPTDAELAQVDAGKARIDEYASKVAEISQQILALPRFVELERRKRQEAADIAATQARAQQVRERLMAVTVADPKSLEHAALNQ